MDSLRDRIDELIKAKHLTPTAFARFIGVASSNFSKMLAGDQTITEKTLYKIVEAFRDVSLDWLKYGRGDMFLKEVDDAPPVAPPAVGADMSGRLMALVESQQKTIENLTESNNRLSRMLDEYKKHSAAAVGIPAVSAVD